VPLTTTRRTILYTQHIARETEREVRLESFEIEDSNSTMTTQTMDSNRNHHQKNRKPDRRRLVRKRATTAGVAVPAYYEQQQQKQQQHQQQKQHQQQEIEAPTIRLLPLPYNAWDGINGVNGATAAYPLPIGSSASSAATINPNLRLAPSPIQPLSSLSSSYNDYGTTQAGAGTHTAGAGMLWRYSATLVVSLAAWLVFLILPKGLRKAYCRSGRRRYSYATSSSSFLSSSSSSSSASAAAAAAAAASIKFGGGATSSPHNGGAGAGNMETPRHANFSNGRNRNQQQQQQHPPPPPQQQQQQQRGGGGGGAVGKNHNIRSSPLSAQDAHSYVPAPSPEHPALARTPDQRILQGTMDRLLGGSGIRLMAHGVQCEPKRVWIRLHLADDDDDDDNMNDDMNAVPHHEKQQQRQKHSLSWQTEFPRQITDASGRTSIVLFRGTTHTIDLATVLYVDVGKKTSALLKTNEKTAAAAAAELASVNTSNTVQTAAAAAAQVNHVPAAACFSLLTGNGSLDLQTNSRLERDALVACLSMVLDQVHQTHEWRRLYEASTIVTMAAPAATAAAVRSTSSIAHNYAYEYPESQSTAARSLNLSNIGTDLFPTHNNKSNSSKYF
jgi:hypothetical protein